MDKELYDLTAPQKSIWLTEQYYKNTNINNVCGIFLSSVALDFDILEKAFKTVVKNNASLRIRLTLKNGEIKQYFDDYSDFNVETVLVNSDEERKKLEKNLNSIGFDLLDSPLFKFTMYKYPDGHGGYILNSNHIISDSWTSGIIANEISRIYCLLKSNESFEKDSSLSYLTYINTEQEYLNSEKFKKDKEYWDSIFETVPEVATIPSVNQKSNSNLSYKAKRLLVNLDTEKLEKLKEYCNKNKVSLYNLFMGVYALYLGRVSNLDDFVIGTPILNRTNFKEKQITGMFINVLPLRFNLNHEQKFNEFISQVGVNSLGLLRHQRYSYNYILEDLRKKDSSLPGLYNVLFSYQITKMNENNDELPHRTSWIFNESTSDDLDIHIFEWNDSNTLQIAYDYKTDKYSEEEISATHERILHVLDQIINNENILLKEIEIVTEKEKHQILYEFNNTKADYPKDKTISGLFEEQVAKTPDNIAVVFEDQKLTYRELNEKANSLAYYLRNIGIKRNDIVGIHLNKNISYIISIISVLKLGATFIPLSTLHPSERIEFILSDSNVKLLISNSNLISKLDIKCKYLDIDSNIYTQNKNIEIASSSNDIAYILYTSGSTGTPKGVMIRNYSLINHVYGINKKFNYDITSKDNILSVANMSFDANLQEIFIPLLLGATLHLLPDDAIYDVNLLCSYIISNKITFSFLPPNLLDDIYEILKNYKDIYLKKLLVGVESIQYKTVNNLLSLNPSMQIHNGYGPTEATICCISYMYDNNNKLNKTGFLPIGTPMSNTKILILNKSSNTLQPLGIPGEICISGDCISPGYVDSVLNYKFCQNKYYDTSMYKTGDFAYQQNDGNILFIGRIDNQVKLNGHRIELEEINNVINTFDNIKKSVTIVKNKKIICFFISNYQINIEELKNFLKNKLPNYMIPSKFIQLEFIPVTVNGKINTEKLLFLDKKSNNSKVIPPQNNTENTLLKIFQKLLQVDNISTDDNFFDLGGDSLLAIKLSIEIFNSFSKNITVKEIFNYSSIKSLALLLEDSIKNQLSNVKIIPISDSYVLSCSQENIYIATEMAGKDSILYNVPGGVIFDKEPDMKKLEKCFNELVKRHESFRTYFEIKNENVVQKILDKIDFHIEISENIISIDNIDNEFKQFVKPFDLSKAPLLRAKFIKIDNGKAVLFVDMHHIISDGTSLSIFVNELRKLYNGETLENIEFTYKDFAYWENEALSSGKFKEAEEFWVNRLKNDIPVLNMPTNYTRPAVKSYEGSKVYSTIDSETLNKVNNICKELSITPYMLLLSVYYILLSKYTGQDDIIVGSPIVGRNFSEIYNIIGMFVNTLPVRTKIDSSLSFKEFLINIKDICLENYKYQNYPLNELISKLNIQRDTSRAPLFDTLFTYQNNGLTSINFNGINSEFYIPDTKISKFDLSLEIIPENNILKLNFEYCTKLFTKQFIENFANHYKNILNIVIDNLDTKISSICMLSEKEKNKILYEFNNTKADYPKDKTISQLFEEQVEKTPNNIAVVFEDQKLTYTELNEKANQLANYLRNNRIGRNDIVGIMVNRSLEMIIAILAVLKAGGTYIPIDPEYPQDRIEYMLNNSNAKLLLTFKNLENKVSFENKVFIELSNNKIYSLNKNNLQNINEPKDSCYIIYTSGSTGLPKGVILKHKSLTNLQKHLAKTVDFFVNKKKQKTVVSVTTISFDIFIFETLICLSNGLKLVVCNEEEQYMPQRLYALLEIEKVEIIQMTPSRMQIFLDNLENIKKLSNIKYVILAGEALPTSLVNRLKSLGVKKIYNGYGPSETTVFSTFTDVTNLTKVNIGRPLQNTQIYILDKELLPCPVSIPGELYISGDGLGNGYLNNIDLNKKLFITNPFVENTLMYKTGDFCTYLPSGEIEYIERIDNQVKIRGLRIELGEIESKILEFPNIKKACVIKQTMNNRDFISAYFTIKKRVNISELRKYLSNFLPRYMVPSYFTALEDFPYTPNGKIDKKALPLPNEILSNSEEKYVSPKTDLQIKLVNIFEQVLNINPIGINDNFFDLGGDSILAMNLNIELKKITDKISYADIFKFPTVSKLEDKINSSDEDYDFKYMEKNYDKYTELLNKNLKIPSIYNLKYNNPGNILLTGATGFFGIHILESFIKNEKGNVYCIIRNETGLTAKLKLQQKLHYYFDNKYDNLIGKRIFAITGDITKPGFGLEQEELLKLSNNIDIVINSAAKVSHFGNYTDFYNINVKSVKYMIDFCKSFNKKFYQISTLSVSGNSLETSSVKQNISEQTLFKENNLYIGQSLENVYVRSKFEAECLVLDAILEGLDAYILRMGNLMPRFRDGVFQENILENAYINRIISFIKIGSIPDYMQNSYLEFTPIDIASNSIIKLISHSNENCRVFHLFNHNHVYLNTVLKYLNKLNNNFEIVDENTFKNKIKKLINNSKEKEILNSLMNDFDKDLHLTYFTDIIIKSENTIKYLEKIGFKWPSITERYLNKFIDLLRMVL
ncbi:MAG: amino acid adenylation domain-containing protein [Candidatus Scatovivens sp.]